MTKTQLLGLSPIRKSDGPGEANQASVVGWGTFFEGCEEIFILRVASYYYSGSSSLLRVVVERWANLSNCTFARRCTAIEPLGFYRTESQTLTSLRVK